MMEWPSFSFVVLACTVLLLLVFKLCALIYHQYVYWPKRGVPSIVSLPIFGSGWKLFFRRSTFPEYCDYVYNAFPKARYMGGMDFATPLIIIRDPELIREVTVKCFEHFPDHRTFVNEDMDPLFGKNVFSLRGDRWKEMRNTLSPSFTASKMRFMYELVSKCAIDFIGTLMDQSESAKLIEAKDVFTRYTTDVIATVAFGITVNSMKDRDNEFFLKGTEAAKFGSALRVFKFLLFRLCPRLMKTIKVEFFPRGTSLFFRRVVMETLKMREEKGIIRPDMIHLLSQARDKNSDKMTIDDIVAQAFIFFFAGFETSSNFMCFLAHELAVNPDVQEKLREEVDRVMSECNDELTYEDLGKMEYMEMVMSETLRKYPALVFIDRLCAKKFELPPPVPGGKPFTVQPDHMLWLPVYSLHHDPQYFPDPEKFDPERFSEENKDKINPYAYLPFGLGPRKCIANRFALMETKIVFAYLLRKFIIHRTEKTQHPIVFSKKSFNLLPEGGFVVKLEKRNLN